MGDLSATEVAKSLLAAFANNDRAAAERLVAPGFHFTSPLDNRLDRTAYFAICWPNSDLIEGFEILRLIENGDEIFVTYVGRSRTGKRFQNTEFMLCRNGQVQEVEVYFGWNLPHDVAEGSHSDPQ